MTTTPNRIDATSLDTIAQTLPYDSTKHFCREDWETLAEYCQDQADAAISREAYAKAQNLLKPRRHRPSSTIANLASLACENGKGSDSARYIAANPPMGWPREIVADFVVEQCRKMDAPRPRGWQSIG